MPLVMIRIAHRGGVGVCVCVWEGLLELMHSNASLRPEHMFFL